MASKSPISLLQEIFAQQKKPLPEYQEVNTVPTDKSAYPFKCIVKAGNIIGTGYASTKKEAKHKCAEDALSKLGIKNFQFNDLNNNINKNTLPSANYANYVGLLNEHASGCGVPYPTYADRFPQNGLFVVECSFLGMKSVGTGTTKKSAKQDSARIMQERTKNEVTNHKIFQHQPIIDIDKDIQLEIIQKYEELSLYKEDQHAPYSLDFELPRYEVWEEVNSMETLIEKLQEKGHICELSTYQRDPYIMMLKVDQTGCVMGNGETKTEAIEDLFVTCRIMFEAKFSFKSVFSK